MTVKIKYRYVIGVMLFFSTFTNYTTRVLLSVSIVSMVKPSEDNNVTFIPECIRLENERQGLYRLYMELPDYGPRYDWDEPLQGHILGAYYYGFVICSFFGGTVAEKVGAKLIIFWAVFTGGIFNVLCVFGTWYHYSLLIVCRVVVGCCGGLVYPALHVLIAKWAPPAEKGKFVASLMGNALGVVVTWPVVGWVTETYGWKWGFYVVSAENAIFCLIFWLLTDDSPHSSKYVSEDEKNFIIAAQEGSVSKKKVSIPPYKAIFLSRPFWMLAIGHVGSDWGLYVQLQSVPKFMAQVIGFDLKDAGGLSSLPLMSRMIFGILFGTLADFLMQRNICSVAIIRKTFTICSHLIPGTCLILMSLSRCSAVGGLLLLIFSLAFNGAATCTNLQNSQDLSPNFSGTLFGLTNFLGGWTGFIGPAVLGQFIRYNSGVSEWTWFFILGGVMYIFCGLVFICFGSAKLQPWNEIKSRENLTNTSNN